MPLAILKFALWEGALCLAALRIARLVGWRDGAERWLGVLAIQVTLESSFAALFSFAGWNSAGAYWLVALVCAVLGNHERPRLAAIPYPRTAALILGLAAPLLVLGFRPVEEIDSINYLHYLIDWMANRATPYAFATNYVAFWELSFLPAWTVTGVDWFFPLLALKAVILMALGLWLVGKELGLDGPLLDWAVFASLTMRHYWFEYSGVPTLKNDALHGVGFVLLALAVLRHTKTKPAANLALLAFGASFASVKYTGIFLTVFAVGLLVLRGLRGMRHWLPVAGLFLITSGHYYGRSWIRHGSPFYPFQINLGPIHLPGTADLSYSSILYNLHDPRLWRAIFLPANGVSPAGLLFPLILSVSLLLASWRCGRALLRRQVSGLDWVAAALLCGWLLYFRSVFSACASPGDLAFILNNLNSIRYVDGVLAVSELFLLALLVRAPWATLGFLTRLCAIGLLAAHLGSRLLMLYVKLSPQVVIITIVVTLGTLILARPPWLVPGAALALLIASPFAVERNRATWTTYWNDLKPALRQYRTSGLAALALEDGGYFAGHLAAAGNPVHPPVRARLPEEIDGLPDVGRPPYLAVLVTPGSEAASDWRLRYAERLARWGYHPRVESQFGGVFERNFR